MSAQPAARCSHRTRLAGLALAGVLLTPALARHVAAQAAPTQPAPTQPAPTQPAAVGTGTVMGLATRAEDGMPIPFALVRLMTPNTGADPTPDPAASSARTVLQVVTNAEGRFLLARVPAGEYRLQLARIGYRPAYSPTFRVAPGAAVRQALRGAALVVVLAPVTVRPGRDCLTVAELADEPRVATLWAEAQKGVELRRAFERQVRFARVLRQVITVRRRLQRAGQQVRVDTVVSEPDSVRVRAERRAAAHAARGYATGNLIELPNELELLDDAFLRDHCLERQVAEEGGALGLRFRPVRERRNGADVRGTIWVAADTYQTRRLEFEYVEGAGAPFARSRLEYGDVALAGNTLRLGTGGGGRHPAPAWRSPRRRPGDLRDLHVHLPRRWSARGAVGPASPRRTPPAARDDVRR